MRLLLDEMYTQLLATHLREREHDVVSVHERRELRSAEDPVIFEAMQVERRAILTNNARHFVPIARRAMEGRVAHHGLILTSDRALPHTRHNLGAYIELLDELMSANPDEDALLNQIRWLRKPT